MKSKKYNIENKDVSKISEGKVNKKFKRKKLDNNLLQNMKSSSKIFKSKELFKHRKGKFRVSSSNKKILPASTSNESNLIVNKKKEQHENQELPEKSKSIGITDDSKVKSTKNSRSKEQIAKYKAKKKNKLKLKKIIERKENSLPDDDPSIIKRTIFVGNVNITATRKSLTKYFSQYGKVDTLRFRGIPPAELDISKKEAATLKKFNKSRKSIIAFVRFNDEESAENALKANGEKFMNLHLRVDKSVVTREHKNTVFIGNLPVDVEDEDIWESFQDIGKIISVRVVRSAETGAGKGFGFVAFDSPDSVKTALQSTIKIKGREIRIKRHAKKPKMNIGHNSGQYSNFMKSDKPANLINKFHNRKKKLEKDKLLKEYKGDEHKPNKNKKKWKPKTKDEKLKKRRAEILGKLSKAFDIKL